MRILGIETSCDETAVAIVEDGVKILSNVIASQIDLHQKTGGVVPEVAARQHAITMTPVIEEALNEAKISLSDIDAIAVTQGPGLISALLVGTQTASTLSILLKKPLIPVHHILGHVYANWIMSDLKNELPEALENQQSEASSDKQSEEDDQPSNVQPKFPALVLTVSGGHNDILYLEDHKKIELVGETQDDAAGEAFDKVAKLLGLGYPGGPAIQKFVGKEFCDPSCESKLKFTFPKAKLPKESFNYSFSGLKTAVLYEIQKNYGQEFNPNDLPEQYKKNIASSFQFTAISTLLDTFFKAAEKYKPKEIHLAGGVSANLLLRKMAEERAKSINIPLRYPKDIKLCTDNAAIIASRAFFQYSKEESWENIQPDANLSLIK